MMPWDLLLCALSRQLVHDTLYQLCPHHANLTSAHFALCWFQNTPVHWLDQPNDLGFFQAMDFKVLLKCVENMVHLLVVVVERKEKPPMKVEPQATGLW